MDKINSNMTCHCGKSYKTVRGFETHTKECSYSNMDISKVYKLGELLQEIDNKLFSVAYGKIKKLAKVYDGDMSRARMELLRQLIFSYRKSLWDILVVWQEELLPSEYRTFIKWAYKTYKDITLLSMRKTLANSKIIYRFNIESTSTAIEKRIGESLIYIHEHGEFSNDFVFVDRIMSGNVSVYYVLFNDWLAQKWFGRLDVDLQKELQDHVDLASKTVLNRLSSNDFDKLHALAESDTPTIHRL